ncbi:cell division cycle protein 123 [Acrasis kona]|uniref:Cell division cycle protein 123 n=1 Tax=Acrasis kona TaxID=1008807 RepID=A0AAW2YU66_9EUKA
MEDDSQPVDAELTYEQINACSFNSWYPLFAYVKPLVTVKSELIQLTQDFINYIKEDGVLLPKSITSTNRSNGNDSDGFSSEEYDEEEDVHSREFPELQEFIQKAINKYGAVFPKCNWSSPRDAEWILTGSDKLKCTSVEDVFLLLKSSQFIIHDLEDAYRNVALQNNEQETKRILVLREWFNFEPSMEFRCFIREGELIAISQRDHQNYYKFLEDRIAEYREKLHVFWKQNVQTKFKLVNYVLDLYINRKGSVFIIDFNVYGHPTVPLLFDWNSAPLALRSELPAEIDFRIVEDECGVIRPSFKTYGGVPSDFYDPTNAQNVMKFIEKCQNEQ